MIIVGYTDLGRFRVDAFLPVAGVASVLLAGAFFALRELAAEARALLPASTALLFLVVAFLVMEADVFGDFVDFFSRLDLSLMIIICFEKPELRDA